MGEVGIGDKRRSRGRKVALPRKNALKDALPDVQPPGAIKETDEVEGAPAESDEEDD
jgi:hypothetical protein